MELLGRKLWICDQLQHFSDFEMNYTELQTTTDVAGLWGLLYYSDPIQEPEIRSKIRKSDGP